MIYSIFCSIINKIYNTIVLKRNSVQFKSFPCIRGRIFISGCGITLGSGVRINSGLKYNPIGGQDVCMLVTHNNGAIVIGNNVGISNSTIVARKSVVIEDDVMIGGSCKIYDNNFHSLDIEHRLVQPDTDIKSDNVVIKKGSFIGAHTIILKGVTIGEKAVIGSGSVVTKNVPDGEVWGGNPARFIKDLY